MTFISRQLAAAAFLSLGATSLSAAEALRYDTPQDAVDAVVAAVVAASGGDLLTVFGSDASDVIFTGELPRDRAAWEDFLEQYDQEHYIQVVMGDRAVLVIGHDNWPFPAPLVRDENGQWAFNAEAAREEVLLRRIGRNELAVIDLMRGYVNAQIEYRMTDQDGDGLMAFASSILSTEGARDGLFWPDGDSPIGDMVARAVAQGYTAAGEDKDPEPYFGYYYQMLSKQSANAPGGEMDYVTNGHQMGGHALLAFPAEYGQTGIMSFLVSENGTVLEADLGEDTWEQAQEIDSYDPTEDWHAVEN